MPPMITIRQISTSTKVFVGLLALYVILLFVLPANHANMTQFNLSTLQYKNLLFIIRLPIIAAWVVAFYAYRLFVGYGKKIADTPEGDDFHSIARGVRWLAWGLPATAVLTQVLLAISTAWTPFTSFA